MRNILLLIGIGCIAVVLSAAIVFIVDISGSYRRIRSSGTVITSPYGAIEYTEGGSGPAVLVIHGAGGGYDQGELLVRAVLGDSFHWIAPSRFGYLRSTFRPGATWDDQAHAYASLLDHLGIKRAAVVALSQGGPSALLFAVHYPNRISSLTLLSCGVASSKAVDQAAANKKGDMLTLIFQHDLLYWTASKLFKKQFMGLMGAPDNVIAGMNEEQQKLAEQVIDMMNPVAPRSAGVKFDNTAVMPNERIAAIRARTLVVHAADDMLQLFHNAAYASATIPGAKLIRFERGGHLVLAVEQKAIQDAVRGHIRVNR